MHVRSAKRPPREGGGRSEPRRGLIISLATDPRRLQRRASADNRGVPMSWQAMNWAVSQRVGSGSAKATLFVIAEAANGRTGACTLSIPTIAARAELGERTVWSALQALEEQGFISRTRRADRAGQRTSDLITLAMGLSSQVAAAAVRPTGAKSQQPRVGPRRPTRNSRTANSQLVQSQLATVAREPVVEPEEEPEGSSLVVPSAAPRSTRAKPKRPMPAGFPDAEALALIVSKFGEAGLPIDAEAEAERFRDHHTAKANLFADWPAAWRTWVGNGVRYAQERADRASGRQPQTTGISWAKGGL